MMTSALRGPGSATRPVIRLPPNRTLPSLLGRVLPTPDGGGFRLALPDVVP